MKKTIFWAFIDGIGPQIIGFIISIILARLLVPSDYGLIGMLSIFFAFAQLFSDLGLSQALIQRKQNSIDDETSVFYLNIGAGVLISLILILISPLVAYYFGEPQLKLILKVLAIGYSISSLGIVHNTLLNRGLEFKKIALIGFVNTICTGTVSVSLAFMGFGVWSLIYGSLVGIISRVIALWVVSNWRPIGSFSMDSVKSIWKYSGNLLGAGLFTNFVDNLSNVLIGRSYSSISLGLYTKANQLQLLPVSLITSIINKIAFPEFSKNQDDKSLLLKQLRMSTRISNFFVSFICFFIIITAEPLILFLFGDQWKGSIIFLRILTLASIFYPINVLLITLIKSVGRSDLFLKVEIVKKVIIMVTLLITVQVSIKAMAFGLIFTGFVAYVLNAKFTIPLIKYNWKSQIYDLLPTWILFCLSGTVTYFFIDTLSILSYFMSILISGLVFMAITFLGVYLLRKLFFKEIWDLTIKNMHIPLN